MKSYWMMNRDSGRNEWTGPYTPQEVVDQITGTEVSWAIRYGHHRFAAELNDWNNLYFVRGRNGVEGIGSTEAEAVARARDNSSAFGASVYRCVGRRNQGWGAAELVGRHPQSAAQV